MYKWHHVSRRVFHFVPTLILGDQSCRTRFYFLVHLKPAECGSRVCAFLNQWIVLLKYVNILGRLSIRTARLCNNGAAGKLSHSQEGRVRPGALSSKAGLEDPGSLLKSHSPVLALQRCLWQSNPDPDMAQNLSPPADRGQFCCPRSFQEWLESHLLSDRVLQCSHSGTIFAVHSLP